MMESLQKKSNNSSSKKGGVILPLPNFKHAPSAALESKPMLHHSKSHTITQKVVDQYSDIMLEFAKGLPHLQCQNINGLVTKVDHRSWCELGHKIWHCGN